MSRRGITLVEALVICVIIGVLLVVLLPSLSTQGRVGKNSRCVGNLAAISKVLAVYAAANKDRLPAVNSPSDAAWLPDQPRGTANLLAATVLSTTAATPLGPRTRLYCPSNRDQEPAVLWNDTGSYAVTGYAWFNDRSGSPGSVLAPASRRPSAPPLAYRAVSAGGDRAELVVDWILSANPTFSAHNAWSGLTYHGRPGMYSTSHMDPAGQPLGGNVLAADGHVEWRALNARTAIALSQTPFSSSESAPYFWIPAP